MTDADKISVLQILLWAIPALWAADLITRAFFLWPAQRKAQRLSREAHSQRFAALSPQEVEG